ncbi:hypothetical protein AX14_004838 [Amanita brunnescens Koide BX004]|nr:hypothetical protein AX14_004838 [Amanita brunnescens Koide BX004]
MAGTTKQILMLKEQYKCPHFRILIIGRANAGKTTILEKVCGVQQGTKPIIYDQNGEELAPSVAHLMPSVERGIHDIEHQITYHGSNFIFHDSRGFESGAIEELEVVWKFIEKQSSTTEVKDQLHAIWYCIPMDSPRPLLSAELGFFNKGTGRVPLVTIFTKFDGQIVAEYVKLNNIENIEDRWKKAKDNAEISFQTVYLPKVLNTEHPPKAHVRLEDMDISENNCPELTEKTADAIDDIVLKELFISTQRNNLNLSVKSALQYVLTKAHKKHGWHEIIVMVLCRFPHFWQFAKDNVCGILHSSLRHISLLCIKQEDTLDWVMSDNAAFSDSNDIKNVRQQE